MQESKRKIAETKAHTRTHSTLIHTHISKLTAIKTVPVILEMIT